MVFHHVQLLTSDLAKQLEFYRNVLGLPILEQSANSVTFQIGISRLEFVQDTRAAFYHYAFNIPPHQFVEAKARLSERVELIRDSSGSDEFRSQNWNANQFYFYDPGGNIAELIARHDLKSDVSEAFSAKSFELISELGIVTDDVPQTVKRIQDLVDAPLYRAVMDEQFVPVGDETGLFIIVKKNRIWFPETKAAMIVPFKVKIVDGQNDMLELDNNSLGLT
jgi:catechol 2,3-dioxygenase-like lactoylglutathione lyase family enzyme